ncbi:MAG: molybdopterin molybdotransferase MoeA [Candidatus Promineifilaceae bacterium]|nr:molybdopterin molybdotransferase MoeA [Candidatus Promineifilaceae bacterium]
MTADWPVAEKGVPILPDQEYLTVAQALNYILASTPVLDSETVSLPEARGRVLSSSVVAQDSLPPFANSAMDGYAVRADDVDRASRANPTTLQVIADISAGTALETTVGPGTAARITTGAPIPVGADAVVPVEETNESWRDRARPLATKIQIYRSVPPGAYIRETGEDIVAGSQVLRSQRVLRPQEIGVLASLGVTQVEVNRRPRAGILATGDELVSIDAPLTAGKIRNSNSYALAAQVEAAGAIPVHLGVARDVAEDVRAKLARGVELGVDLLISSAGVSVGAYDVVKAVLEQNGQIAFWKVRMRPGKPLAYGTYQGIPYFGLPGNPVSALVSFERFTRPTLRKMGGHQELERPRVTVTLQETIDSDGRESYIRAQVKREGASYTATTTGEQGSHMLTSLVKANGLIVIPEGVQQVEAGERLEAVMLDWPETVF